MCRVLAYLGKPVLVDDLLYKPDSSLVTQAHDPKMLHMLNLAGFGLMAWDERSISPAEPWTYRSTAVPVFDANLKALAGKVKARAVIAHVRGVAYHSKVSISEQNLHPFRFEGCRWAMAHNGDLFRFAEMRYALLEHLKPELAQRIKGNTDSEWMYALALSQLKDPGGDVTAEEMAEAVVAMLRVVRKVREAKGIDVSSPANLFFSDGQSLIAVRFTFDFGCYPIDQAARVHEMQLKYLSLWYTLGKDYGLYDGEWKMRGGPHDPDSVMVASEPLTRDTSSWLEVPEYGLVYVDGRSQQPAISKIDIDA